METADALAIVTRYAPEYYRDRYATDYEATVAALRSAYPELHHWAACRVPRRWARLLVSERDAQLPPPAEGWTAATTMSGRIVAAPPDDTFVVLGLEKPHASSAFANDPDFFGACQWETL
jgi:hypothetical protein